MLNPSSSTDKKYGLLERSASASSQSDEFPIQNQDGKVHNEDGHSSGCFATGSVAAGTYMLSSISLGIGVFAFPDTMRLCGLAGGTILLIIFAFVTGFCQYILLLAATELRTDSYEETARIALGPFGTVFQSLGVILSCMTGNSAHIQAIGSLLSNELVWFVTGKDPPTSGFALPDSRKLVLYILLLLFALPLCLHDDLRSIRNISTFSVSIVMVITAWFVVYCMWTLSTDQAPDDVAVPAFGGHDYTAYFRASGSVAFAFTGCVNLFSTVDQMKDPAKAPVAIAGSSALCFAIYFCAALLGSLTFGTTTVSNCLYNVLPQHRDTLRPLVFLLIVAIVLLYPIINFPLVYNVQRLIWGERAKPKWSRGVITVLTMLVVLMVDYFVIDIYDVFGLCGTFGLGITCLILPTVIFLKTDRRSLFSPIKLAALASLVLGLVVSSAGTYFVVKHIVSVAN